jgi:hypothetical protein
MYYFTTYLSLIEQQLFVMPQFCLVFSDISGTELDVVVEYWECNVELSNDDPEKATFYIY